MATTTTENRGPDKGEAYGVAAVTQSLSGIDFPASKQDILEKVKGNEEIHWTKEKTVNLRELLDEIEMERFETMNELVEAISQKSHE